MKPTKRSAGMEQTLANIFRFDRRDVIRKNQCAPTPFGCGIQLTAEEIESWPEVERREYTISGLCSTCQAKAFND